VDPNKLRMFVKQVNR